MTYLFQDGGTPPRRNEIILDSFAGGGGASTGIEMALGRSPDVAINHDPEAVAMHAANHPNTEHFCQSVWKVDPADVAARGPIGLAWFSPDCKHFSKAKGGKPVEKGIRDLAWIVVAYARLPAHLRPRVICLENVEEFLTWGPLGPDHMPDKKRAGEEFAKWRGELRRLGYKVETRILRACDYGAPTIRKRLFLIARCDGRAIVWPDPTHGDPKSEAVRSGKLLPWRTAAECIDWSIPCPSIFERKKPLADATLRRIAAGTMRYVVNAARPFIVPVTHSGSPTRAHDIDEPLRTITTAKRGEFALIAPTLTGCGGRAAQSPPRSADAPMGTITAKADQILVAAHLQTMRNAAKPFNEADAPMHTITAGGAHIYEVAAFLTKYHGTSAGAGADEPFPTITANSFHKRPGGNPPLAICAAHLTKHYGGVVGHGVEQPIGTVTTSDHHSVTTAHLTHLYGSDQGGAGDPEAPAKTITAGGNHAGLVCAFLDKYFGSAEVGQVVDDPLHTVTAKPRFGLVTVTVDGEPYVLSDIGMRMLMPRELFRAQSFPESYIIDIVFNGKRLSKASQVRMCGNSVPPVMAEAIVRANAADLAVDAIPMEAAE
jgi:DNA (cytosine-5)-methyltransferase 1